MLWCRCHGRSSSPSPRQNSKLHDLMTWAPSFLKSEDWTAYAYMRWPKYILPAKVGRGSPTPKLLNTSTLCQPHSSRHCSHWYSSLWTFTSCGHHQSLIPELLQNDLHWPDVTQCWKTISSSEFSKNPNPSLLIWWLKHQLAPLCTVRSRTRFCIRRNIQSGGEHHDQPRKICVIGLTSTFSFTLTTATIIQANTVIKWHKLVSYF